MTTLPNDIINWYGYHGYVSSKHMPEVLGIAEPFCAVTPLAPEPISFRFLNHVDDAQGELRAWLFEGDAPAGHVFSVTVFNDLGNSYINSLGNS